MVDILCEREGSNLYNSIANSNPERCVRLSRSPSVHVYYALKMKLEQCTAPWLNGFLELGGLQTLLDSLEKFNGKGFTNFSDAVLQLDCINCIKSVLNTKAGIKYFVEQEDYVSKLTVSLNTPNMLPKKQIFELLTVICTYSLRGRYLVMDGLTKLKKLKNTKEAFSLIIDEMKLSDTAAYRKGLLGFVNVLIGSHDNVEERCRVRDVFIGLGILDVVQTLKKDEKDVDLAVQIETFFGSRHKDDEFIVKARKVDVTDQLSTFHAINNKVFGRPESSSFQHILQDIYILETVGHDKPLLWLTLAKTTNYIANMASTKEADNFLKNLQNLMKDSSTSPPNVDSSAEPPLMKRVNKKLFSQEENTKCAKGSSQTCDQIMEVEDKSHMKEKVKRRDSGISVTSNPSPYDNVQEFRRNGKGRVPLAQKSKLNKVQEGTTNSEEEQDSLKEPTKHVKPVPLIKVDAQKANRVTSIWKQMSTDNSKNVKLDFGAIQDEYEDSGISDSNDEIQLLSNETVLNINVFLARLEANPEELAECFSEGDDGSISVEAFRHLMKILPSEEEINQLRDYPGSRYDLGQAEQFLLFLSDLPDYRTLLKGLLYKSEFTAKYAKLRDNLQAIVTACRDVIHHPGLRDFLGVLVKVANFMNKKNHIGECTGVKLHTLERFYEVRGQSHHSNLLETVIHQVEMQDEEIMLFTNDFPTLTKAAEHCLDELRTDVTDLNDGLKKLLRSLSTAHNSVKSIFQLFIEDVKVSLEQLHSSIARLKGLSQQMSLYFCVDDSEFDLHVTLKHLHNFVNIVKKCKKVGYQQRVQAEMVKTRIESLRNNPPVLHIYGRKSDGHSFAGPQKDRVVETILNQIHQGVVKRYSNEDGATPDMEGNPLLRRLAPPITSTPANPANQRQKLTLVTELLSAGREMPSPLGTMVTSIPDLKESPIKKDSSSIETRKNSEVLRPIDLPPLVKHEQDLPTPVKKIDLSASSPLKDVSNLHVDGKAKKGFQAEEEACTSWVLQRWEKNDERKTYVDRVEQIVDERYHRQQQMMTGSFLATEDEKEAVADGARPISVNGKEIKIYPKISCNPCGHRRSASNIDRSITAADRWMTYEKETSAAAGHKPESKSNLICLGLEKGGKLLGSQDLDALETLPKEEPVPLKREKKRSSFGFLKRLSKAVKGQKGEAEDPPKKEKKKTSKKEKKPKKKVQIAGKENVVLHSVCVSDTNC